MGSTSEPDCDIVVLDRGEAVKHNLGEGNLHLAVVDNLGMNKETDPQKEAQWVGLPLATVRARHPACPYNAPRK